MEYKVERIGNPCFIRLKFSGIQDVEKSRDIRDEFYKSLSAGELFRLLMDERELEVLSDTRIDFKHAS